MTTTSTTTAPPTSAPPTSADIGTRVLSLLSHLHGPDDLAPAAIERATGVAVTHDPDDAERYGFGLPLEPGWMCHLSTIPNRLGPKPTQLMISYDAEGQDDTKLPPSAPVLEDFAQALVQAGYRRERMIGARNVLRGEVFNREDVEIRVNVECDDPTAETLRLRITRIAVDADVKTNTFVGAEDNG